MNKSIDAVKMKHVSSFPFSDLIINVRYDEENGLVGFYVYDHPLFSLDMQTIAEVATDMILYCGHTMVAVAALKRMLGAQTADAEESPHDKYVN